MTRQSFGILLSMMITNAMHANPKQITTGHLPSGQIISVEKKIIDGHPAYAATYAQSGFIRAIEKNGAFVILSVVNNKWYLWHETSDHWWRALKQAYENQRHQPIR